MGIWNGTGDPITLSAGKFVPGPHSINGQFNNHSTHSDTNDSYVRMAWDTGGAAWDIGLTGADSSVANALRDTFINSLGTQINDAAAIGKVFRADEVLLAYNLGDGDVSGTEFKLDPLPSVGFAVSAPSTRPIDTNSNSLPISGTGSPYAPVLRSAKQPGPPGGGGASLNLSLSPSQFPTLTDGRYVVELYFSEIRSILESNTLRFNVEIEGTRLLTNYKIIDDRAKIQEVTGNPYELDSVAAGWNTAIVKRFQVDVTSEPVPGFTAGAGLQIRLASNSTQQVLINGIRILKTAPPRIENIIISGSEWENGVDYSYASIVPTGMQLAPIYTDGVNKIQVKFDKHMVLTGSELKLYRSNFSGANPTEVTGLTWEGFNATTFTATWTLTTPLIADKYRIDLATTVKDGNGQLLDGEWFNDASGSNDDFSDDEQNRRFLTGNGVAGTTNGELQFLFSVLPGDYNQDGVVNGDDDETLVVKDGDGDGVIENGQNVPSTEDKAIATAHMGWKLPGRIELADYNDDEVVDFFDYAEWTRQLGQDSNLSADGNRDGVVDNEDFFLWEYYEPFGGAWHRNAGGYGDVLVVDQVGTAPQVIEVTISGSNSTHVPFGFDAHGWDGSGKQLDSVQVGGADTIAITFNEQVNVAASNLRLFGMSSYNVPAIEEFTYDIATMTATWRFDSWWTVDDFYLISLNEAVTDTDGNLLNGEWVNPATRATTNQAVSEFPSGIGGAGGNFNFVVTLFRGDLNSNLDVDLSDMNTLTSNFFGSTTGMTYVQGDVNGDGDVTITDKNIQQANFFVILGNPALLADLNGDSVVDELDIEILEDHFFDTDFENGDLNDDGVINALDADLFFAQLGLEFRWVS